MGFTLKGVKLQMPVYKDNKRGTWYWILNYKNEYGKENKKKHEVLKQKKKLLKN